VIMITGHGDMETVITALREGAIDFLRKPFQHDDLQVAIERSQKFVELQQRLQTVEDRYSLISRDLEERIERQVVGESDAMRTVLDQAMNAAAYPDVNVLISGESGTGKEAVARIIHHASDRSQGSFFAVNCSSIPEHLMESEFFGHRKGAFTGAVSDHKGFFELTRDGTLFLDEIADTPPSLQAKLLRVIEEQKIRRLGQYQEIEVDVRIVAATNQDIDRLIEEQRFRLDLLHRLNTMHIDIPPLRERVEDIEPLVLHFAREFSRRSGQPVPVIDSGFLQALQGYRFPGNVRELKNLVERAVILSQGDRLVAEQLQLPGAGTGVEPPPAGDLNIASHLRQLVENALEAAGGNQTRAAQLLGISRHSLIRRMEKLGIGRKRGEE